MIRVAIAGAAGRMGEALVAALPDHPDLQLVVAFERPGSEHLGRTVRCRELQLPIAPFSVESLAGTDILIDFTRPQAAMEHASACAAAGKRVVIGTTGFDDAGLAVLRDVARRVAVVHAPNMSPGVNVCFQLVALAARALGSEVDIEVLEAHHRHKKDAPSGTALRFGEIAASARGETLARVARHDRHGATAGPRTPGEIGFSVVRGGDIVGDHTVLFALPGERIEITHRASSRDNFAHGALRAAAWLMDRPAGLFDMQDVLGLR
ncbi:MAG: 4-hydroxy-tetrahydrodipicolinate reductase [Acidiferrobacteraceae bacterium]